MTSIVSTDAQIEGLVGRMTLGEKVGQLSQFKTSRKSGGALAEDSSGVKRSEDMVELIRDGRVGSLLGACGITNFNAFQRVAVKESRLGIPLMVGHDMIHGAKTQFPIPLALSCAWDESLWKRCGRLIALESPLKGCNWTFAPMIDIARDARWGRIAEGPGQDPYLASRLAASLVEGIQSRDVAFPVAACLKHFVGYGAAFQGRDYNAVEMSESTLRNIYLPPFQAGITAGALTVMPAFHSLNGVPCSMNASLLTDILRDEMGFKGFTISDWDAIPELGQGHHGMAETEVDLSALAINAGMDQEMKSGVFVRGLVEAVNEGKVQISTLNEAVRRVLRVKKALGLWQCPYIDESAVTERVDLPAHARLAREAASKSCVLLKNDGSLPLKKTAKIALVGPGLDDEAHMIGCWATYAENKENTTVVEGFKAAGADFLYVPAYNFTTGSVDFAALQAAVAGADVVVASFGEHGKKSGEGWSVQRLELPPLQLEALEALSQMGKPIVALVTGGRPLAIPQLMMKANSVLLAWSLGSSGGEGVVDVLTGNVNPSGRLTIELPYATGQMPLFYNRTATGRPTDVSQPFTSSFRDGEYVALCPFGYGLSYTTFKYSNERVEVVGGCMLLSCDVANVGALAGEEVVQAYTRQLIGIETRPIRELRGWVRCKLYPGETRRVTIEIPLARLSYYAKSKLIPASGKIQAWIAPDSVRGVTLEACL